MLGISGIELIIIVNFSMAFQNHIQYCSAERSFTGLRRLKPYLRSTVEQQRFSNIALINIEREYANSVVNRMIVP